MFTRRERGFTIVELLVVIAIIGVLVALLLPAVQMARESARRSQCTENLKQLANAINLYANSKGHLPPSRFVAYDKSVTPAVPYVVNWVCMILPEIEQASLHQEIIRTGTWQVPPTPIKVLMCPSQPRFESKDYPLSYVVNGGRANFTDLSATIPIVNFDQIENGVFVDKGVLGTTGVDKHRIEEIAKYDGTSNTLMLSENPNVHQWFHAADPPTWATSKEQYSQMLWFPEGYQKANMPSPPPNPRPLDPTYDPTFDVPAPALACGLNRSVRDVTPTLFDSNASNSRYGRPGSYHPGGFNFAKCDGSVDFMSETLDYGVYAVLMTSRGDRSNDPDPAKAKPLLPYPWWQSTKAANYPGTAY